MLIRKLLLFRPVVGPFKGASSSTANHRGVLFAREKLIAPVGDCDAVWGNLNLIPDRPPQIVFHTVHYQKQ